ncbi:hypothetical protein HYC85_012195 [Camellia sinensis]|uniref:Uncharacterized protein n=1 Tax=Camellia sinensis TaxID=4442 RepID=A0A7J7HB91_CAMSI|nr:hypothetical protein HYC85_012195 [Camellia sinensis]
MLWVTIRRRILCQASSLQRCFRSLWNQILACTLGKSCTYRQLPHTTTMSSPSLVASERGFETPDMPCGCCEHSRDSSDLVALKISLLGDSQIGKTSFLAMLSDDIKNQGNGIRYPCSASPPHLIFLGKISI